VIFNFGEYRIIGVEGDVRPPKKSETPRKTLLTYGSSITHGSNSLAAPNNWTSLVAHHLNTDLRNLGFAGSCCMEPEMIEYIASEYSNLVKDRIHGSITDEEIEEYYDVETMGEKDETLLRNVGHILFKVDTNAYKTREEALDAALKVLDELKSKEVNGIVEKEVFGELGKEYTYDSNVFYDNVKMGEMIQPFEEWLFAATTKGEIGLIETVYGIHIMYYGGETVPAWKFRAREELTNEKMQKWFISLEYSVTIPDNIFESILLK